MSPWNRKSCEFRGFWMQGQTLRRPFCGPLGGSHPPRKKNKSCEMINGWLVGGFNPFEKYESNWITSPNRGEHEKYLKPPPRWTTTTTKEKQQLLKPSWLNQSCKHLSTINCGKPPKHQPLWWPKHQQISKFLPQFHQRISKHVCLDVTIGQHQP